LPALKRCKYYFANGGFLIIMKILLNNKNNMGQMCLVPYFTVQFGNGGKPPL